MGVALSAREVDWSLLVPVLGPGGQQGEALGQQEVQHTILAMYTRLLHWAKLQHNHSVGLVSLITMDLYLVGLVS